MYLFLRVACALDDLPEVEELVVLDLAVVVVVNGIEELLGRDFSKILRPMLYRLVLLNSF
jgi:hypothetical protein